MTISVGIAVHPETTTDRDELLRAADGALYWSKNHGRARTCVYEPSIVHARSRQEIAQEAERMARLRAAESLIRVVDAKDTYTGQHSLSVSRTVEGIAREMELPAEQVEQLRLAGLLHDLGKIAIPDRILQKPGALDEAEEAALREHPEIGYRLVEGAGSHRSTCGSATTTSRGTAAAIPMGWPASRSRSARASSSSPTPSTR